jgi:hypothetical protein
MAAIPPRTRQPHVILGGVGAFRDDLGGGVPMRRPVHLVLHRLEEEAEASVRGS